MKKVENEPYGQTKSSCVIVVSDGEVGELRWNAPQVFDEITQKSPLSMFAFVLTIVM